MARTRPLDALRQVTFETGYIAHHPGSVLVSFGNTRVLVAATVEDRVPPHRVGSGGGWLTAEYAMLPAATHDRKQREISRGKQDARSSEIQRLIGRALRNVVNIDVLGQRTIHVDCDVIQADGGTRTASITGAYVAIVLCVQDLLRRGVPMRAKQLQQIVNGQVAAVSLGILDGQILTDLDYSEDSTADVDLNLVARADGSIIEVQGTAEGAPMTRAQLDGMITQGLQAIEHLTKVQNAALEDALKRSQQ